MRHGTGLAMPNEAGRCYGENSYPPGDVRLNSNVDVVGMNVVLVAA